MRVKAAGLCHYLAMRKRESRHAHRSSSSHHAQKDRKRLIYDSKRSHRKRSRSHSSDSRHRSPSFSLLRNLSQGATFEDLAKTHPREIGEIRLGLRSSRVPDPYHISYTPVLVTACDLPSSIDSSQKVRFDLQFDVQTWHRAKEARKQAEQLEVEAGVRLEAVQQQLRSYLDR